MKQKSIEAKIDELLLNEDKLNNYIKYIEEEEINIPNSLNEKITNILNVKKTRKSNYFNILKIVACTIFALIIWQTTFSKPLEAKDNIKQNNTKYVELFNKIDNAVKDINEFLMKPSSLNKGEKE